MPLLISLPDSWIEKLSRALPLLRRGSGEGEAISLPGWPVSAFPFLLQSNDCILAG